MNLALDVRATEDRLGVHLVVRPAANPEGLGGVDAAERLRVHVVELEVPRELLTTVAADTEDPRLPQRLHVD